MKYMLKLSTDSKIRAIDICPSEGKIFVANYDLGKITVYKWSVPFSTETTAEIEDEFQGPKSARTMKYWKERNELYIGCAQGKMSVVDLNNTSQGPICKHFFLFTFFNFCRFDQIAYWRHH